MYPHIGYALMCVLNKCMKEKYNMQYIILKIYNKLQISMLILLDMYDII